MKLGLSTYDIAASDLTHLARAADEAGFESLWLGEHVVLPLAYESEHPTTGGATVQHHTGPIIDPSTILVDPLVALAGAASVTNRLHLATGIYLAPLRHPILIARATATLHDLTQGRFMLGVGSGWLREEFDALGIAFGERASRFDETLDALQQLWSGEIVTHRGRHFEFGPVQLGPHSVEVPLILGGNTDVALRRVARRADGWFSSGTPTFDEARTLRDRLGSFMQAAGRTQALPLWFRAPLGDGDELDRYVDDDFEHVVLWADRFWPTEGDTDHKRSVFHERLEQFGISQRLAPRGA
jgi:probable F420-dependent oxidoreductase